MAETFGSSPIFIVGYMHSGTTLLQKLLGGHPELFTSKGETKYFELMPMIRRRFVSLSSDAALREVIGYIARLLLHGFQMSDLANGVRAGSAPGDLLSSLEIEELVARARANPELGAIFRVVFDHLAARSGRRRWMEKTPTHIFHVGRILAAIPDAQFVEITRDVRDVLASKKSRRADVWTSPRYTEEQRRHKHNEKAFDPLWDALSWKSAIVAGRNARVKYPDRFMQISYEQLATHPEQTVRAICRFLGLTFDLQMLDVPPGNSADYRPDKPRGVYKESVNRWQKGLTPAEAAIAQTVCSHELTELGYQIESISTAARVRSVPVLARSAEGLATRIVRRWRLGGTSYLRNVLRDYGERLAVVVSAKR